MHFEIEKAIFEHFPGMKIVVAVAKNIQSTADKEKIMADLHDAWKIAASAFVEYGNPQSHPNIKPWGDRMKAVGVSRKQFPSSIEALVRRAGKNDVPVSISPLVDFYNAVSLRHLVPVGGFDIDALNNDLWLRFSKQGDTFLSLDSNEIIEMPEGEVSYADGPIIITRHFVWKQAKHSILTAKSKNVLFVSEILGELQVETADEVGDAISNGLKQFFGIDVPAILLDINNSGIEL